VSSSRTLFLWPPSCFPPPRLCPNRPQFHGIEPARRCRRHRPEPARGAWTTTSSGLQKGLPGAVAVSAVSSGSPELAYPVGPYLSTGCVRLKSGFFWPRGLPCPALASVPVVRALGSLLLWYPHFGAVGRPVSGVPRRTARPIIRAPGFYCLVFFAQRTAPQGRKVLPSV